MNIKSAFIENLEASGKYKAYIDQLETILNKYTEFLQFDPFEVKDDFSNIDDVSNRVIAGNKLLKQDSGFVNFNAKYGHGVPSAIMGKLNYLDYLKEIKFTNTTINGDYFDLKGFSGYKDVSKTTYKGDTKEARWYYDTREKLYRLVALLGDRLNENYEVVYTEQPNGQAGRGKINFKDYILAGFSPDGISVGDELFMKVSFGDLTESAVFSINLDMNFRKHQKYFNHQRDYIFKKDYKEWPVDENFPKNWNDLLQLISGSIKKLQISYTNYINEKKNSEMISNELQGFIKILNYKKQIILQGPPGTGKTKLAGEIAEAMIGYDNLPKHKPLQIKNEDILSTLKDVKDLSSVAGNVRYQINIIAENKVVLEGSNIDDKNITFNKIIEFYRDNKWENSVTNGNDRGAAAIAKYIFEKIKLVSNPIWESEQYEMVQFHPSYTYEDFVRGISSKPNETGSGIVYKAENKIFGEFAKQAKQNYLESTEAGFVPKKYVLIIDEINRANLSAVLGELIYGLEYRGDEVESIYSVDDSNKLVLSPNLFVIGTMNTADRSVGSIDYAIRRRFAFINVMPKILTDVPFETDLFKQVAQLFVKDIEADLLEPSEYLSSEFKPEDVWLGHSYFIKLKDEFGAPIPSALRLKYEIKPILKEYLNDGIFKERGAGQSTIDFINKLEV